MSTPNPAHTSTLTSQFRLERPQWQAQMARIEARQAHTARWQRDLARVKTDMGRLIKAFADFAQSDEAGYRHRVAELYRVRTGVAYLLPLGGIEIAQLYEEARNRLLAALNPDELAPSAGPAASVVRGILAARGGWRQVLGMSRSATPDRAVASVRDLIRTEVMACLRSNAGEETPLLPRLCDLIAEAAGEPRESVSLRDYVEEFREKLATLVPPRFTPQGNGPMKVLVSYPADTRNARIEVYLRESINLPRGSNVVYEMENTQVESVSVVMYRTSMGLTDVPEVRDVLRLWVRSQARPEPGDMLRWRQRTGFAFDYLVTDKERRAEILQRLLCALWNGKVRTDGDVRSPDRITVEPVSDGVLSIQLSPLEDASSWGSLLHAYELHALDGDDTRRLICARLMC